MPTVAHAHTTLASVKQYLGITVADDDALLEKLIDNITEFVEGQLNGRRIKLTSYVDEEHDGGEADIFLFNFPIAASPTLIAEFRTGTISSPTFTPFTADDFIVYENGGFVHFFGASFAGSGRVTPRGSKNLRFTYDAGFTDIPDDLELLAKQLVGKVFQRRTAQGIKKETVEGSSIEYNLAADTGDLTDEQKSILDRYQNKSVGENL